ncbi:HtaA domain-containing protein [Streptomyces sp. NPDC047108]|uniref:HtaA domain-containing protein n=1 Tax=Streptomyces sp. NPDC047108 TaxID=3155025 RepID=UPI0033F5B256
MLPSGPARTLVPVLLAALTGVALATAPPVRAADRTVAGGRLDWGVKSSFQSYVTGPIAKGRWSLTGGAATVGDSRFRFHSAAGSYDRDSGAFRAGFSGGVHFTGHRQQDGTYRLDLTVSRPTVRISGGTGTLYADLTSRAKTTGKVTTSAQVPLATLGLSGVSMRGGGSSVVLKNLPATLTSQGARAFAGYYAAGTPLDPVSLSADVKGAGPGTGDRPDAEDAEDRETGGREEKPAREGEFRDAAVDWGVRRTWREYVTGTIAQGEWKLSDGARDGGALFRFPSGRGSYDRKKATLDARFEGRIRFTGRHGLDLALSGVEVAVRKGRGTLSADVTNPDVREQGVPLVEFDVSSLRPEGGLITVTEAPATLTSRGAQAFGGVYRAGTAMDPVSLAVALDAGARLPRLPDLGSDTGASPSAGVGAGDGEGERAAPRQATAASDAFPLVPVTFTAGAVLACLAIGAGAVAVRRKRGRAGADSADSVSDSVSASASGTSGGDASEGRHADAPSSAPGTGTEPPR